MTQATEATEQGLSALSAALETEQARATAERTLAWAREQGVAHDDLPKLVVVATSYAHNCSPPGRRTPQRSYDLAARFILLFLLVDDADPQVTRALLEGREPWTIGPYTRALRAFLAELEIDLVRCDESLRRRFETSYHEYLETRLDELQTQTQPQTVDEHWAFRRRTIFLEPYIDLWMIVLHVSLEIAAPLQTARSKVVDVVLLANDLGSFERDSSRGEAPDDLTLVDAYVRERATTREGAAALLLELHNALVAELRSMLSQAEPGAIDYANLLRGMVDGNLASLRALRFRYPGVQSVLDRLDAVSTAA